MSCLLGYFHEYELYGTLCQFLGIPKFAEDFDCVMDESILWIVEMEGIRTKFVLVGGVFNGTVIMNSNELAEDQRVRCDKMPVLPAH